MTRALVWKELREQWPIWLALALVATGAVAALFALFSPGTNRDEMLTAVLWLTAWGYGLVCGAVLLAGETEGATQPFLDTLPGSRPRIWRVKAAAGLLMLAAQLAALVVIGFVLFGERYKHLHTTVDLTGMLLFGVVGYAWGLYCGSFAGNVPGAVARAVVLQAVWAAVLYASVTLAMALYLNAIDQRLQDAILAGVTGLIATGAAARSRAIYCRPDRLRDEALRPRTGISAWLSRAGQFRETCWEARQFALGMALYGVAGVAALFFLGVAAWPVLTLVLGVLCGVTALAGEPGWVGRAGVRFAIGVGTAGMMTLAVLVPNLGAFEVVADGIQSFFRTNVSVSAVSALATDPSLFLAFWLVEGFACGVLAGLLLRKRLMAAAAGLALAGLFGGIWMPAVYTGGGLHARQMWAGPAVLLVTTSLLAHFRAAGRLKAAGVFAAAGCAVLAVGVGTAAALWERAYEMPPVPDAIDVEAFVATLPGPAENAGGRLTSDGLLDLAEIERTFDREAPFALPPVPGRPLADHRIFFIYLTDADRVNDRGWAAADPRLPYFLDQVFARDWPQKLADAAGRPTGILIDPRDATSTSAAQFQSAVTAATLLSARGLQLQAGGDPEAFVDNLHTGLAVARTLRHFSTAFGASHIPHAESTLSRGVERWLERLDGRPDLLRRALAMLLRHLDEPQADPDVTRRVEFLIMLNAFADPSDLPRIGRGADPFARRALNDSPVLRYSWETPWEKVRLRRVLEGLASGDAELRQLAKELAPPVAKAVYPLFVSSAAYRTAWSRPRHLYPCRVAALQVALRLFREETGRPAEKLDELVPKYLPAVPADPYDGRPFRYRLSRGETLDWPPDSDQFPLGAPYGKRRVPAGQGILWAVGENKTDDGGRVQEWSYPTSIAREKEDRISLVPLPPGRP